MDDEKIIDMYFARDERAIAETDIKYGALCFSIADNILNSASDAEECVSDTYLGVWNCVPPTRPNCFRAFICRIARNLSLKRLEYRLAQKRSESLTVSLSELEEILPDERIAADADDEHIGELISDFLKSEKSEARNVFIRRYFFFDSVDDIARSYSFSPGKVRNLLYRSRKRLKEYLEKEGVRI